MSTSVVAVRELKARLSEYLSKVKEGNIVEITSRGETIARIVPSAPKGKLDPMDLVRDGFANWNGKKVPAKMPTLRLKGSQMASDLVSENRD